MACYYMNLYCNYFNPRTHRGVRPFSTRAGVLLTFISIHAPIVGCDKEPEGQPSAPQDFNPRTHRGVRRRREQIHYTRKNFNPRTHRGVRLRERCSWWFIVRFQSTHPSWGATVQMANEHIGNNISIHAPIVGCDTFICNTYIIYL